MLALEEEDVVLKASGQERYPSAFSQMDPGVLDYGYVGDFPCKLGQNEGLGWK